MDSFTNLDPFHQVIDKYGDPRIRNWFLMSSPIPTILASLIYLYVVKVSLPAYMRDRKPYELKKFVVRYNLIQVIFSTWLFYGFFVSGWMRPKFSLKCFEPRADKNMIFFAYMYYLSKYTEFIDTILFVLRKKESQVTYLHLYHHSILPIGSWIAVKYVPDSQMTFLGLVNSFVHIVMYSYYLLSALGPQMQKFLWWKKYITILQLAQFVVCLLISIQSACFGCGMLKPITWFNIVQSLLFFFMFLEFYIQSYNQKKSTKNSSLKEVNGVKYADFKNVIKYD